MRALELEPYGMIGLGSVFEWYRTGRIEDDLVRTMAGNGHLARWDCVARAGGEPGEVP